MLFSWICGNNLLPRSRKDAKFHKVEQQLPKMDNSFLLFCDRNYFELRLEIKLEITFIHHVE